MGRLIGLAVTLIVIATTLGILLGILWRTPSQVDGGPSIASTAVNTEQAARKSVGDPTGSAPRANPSVASRKSGSAASDIARSEDVVIVEEPEPVRSGSRAEGARNRAPLILECERAFRPDDSEASLRTRYGAENVKSDTVHIGEGMYWRGSVLFADDSLRRVEIAWQDTIARRIPMRVFVIGSPSGESEWKTIDGITHGTDLRALERMNGRFFYLAGFGWDGAGGILDWNGETFRDITLPPVTSGCACQFRAVRVLPDCFLRADMTHS